MRSNFILALVPLTAACFQLDLGDMDFAFGADQAVASITDAQVATYAVDAEVTAPESASRSTLAVQLSGQIDPTEVTPASRMIVRHADEVVLDIDLDDTLDFGIDLPVVECDEATCASTFDLEFELVGTGAVAVEWSAIALGGSDVDDDDTDVAVSILPQ